MRAYMAHIETVNPAVNAIVSMKPRELCLKEAVHADTLLAKGEDMGWLHGVPQAIKDLANTKDIATTQGSPLFAKSQPRDDGLMVSRIRKAGGIIIGKTNTPEFGLGSQTYNQVFGATRNAYDQSRCAGGSSGGAAVALALRMLPVADGSDMMGSLRNPAAYNNIFGFRPSAGLVPFYPVSERIPMEPAVDIFTQQLAYEGPMGRSVADLSWLLSVQAGYDSRVPLSLKTDAAIFRQDLSTELSDRRIAYLGDFDGYLPMETGILELCEEALRQTSHWGMKHEAVKFSIPPELIWRTWLVLRQYSIGNKLKPLYDDPAKRILLKPESVWEIEESMKLTGEDVFKANVARSQLFEAMSTIFENFDYIALPTAQVFAFDVSLHWPKSINNRTMDTYHRWMEVAILASLSGCPTLNVPVGFSSKGLAMGMQIIGKPGTDRSVLQFGHAYEQNKSWTEEYPPELTGGKYLHTLKYL
jgi:amidase